MLGAFCGDILGAPYEVNTVTFKDFILLADNARYTDDSVCSMAVAAAILDGSLDFTGQLRKFGRDHGVAYGPYFEAWLHSDEQTNNSAGNGSVSRVSSIPWMAENLEQTLDWASASAMTSHRHADSVDAACAVAAAAWLALDGWSKDRMAKALELALGYDLSTPLDTIRPGYGFRLLASETAPIAIRAVIEGKDFEDVLRLSISMGGDADTIAAAAGGIAEAYHRIPNDIAEHVHARLPEGARDLLIGMDEIKRPVDPQRTVSADEFLHTVELIRSKTRQARHLINGRKPGFWSRLKNAFDRAVTFPV